MCGGGWGMEEAERGQTMACFRPEDTPQQTSYKLQLRSSPHALYSRTPSVVWLTDGANDASVPYDVRLSEYVEEGNVLYQSLCRLCLTMGHWHRLGCGVGREVSTVLTHPPAVHERYVQPGHSCPSSARRREYFLVVTATD